MFCIACCVSEGACVSMSLVSSERSCVWKSAGKSDCTDSRVHGVMKRDFETSAERDANSYIHTHTHTHTHTHIHSHEICMRAALIV